MLRFPIHLLAIGLLCSLGCERTEVAQRLDETPEEMRQRLQAIADQYIAEAWDKRSIALENGVLELSPDNTYLRMRTPIKSYEFGPIDAVFMELTGRVEVDPETDTLQSVKLKVPATSLTPGDEAWNDVVRGKAFMNAEEHPMATFESTSIRAAPGEDHIVIDGVWSMRGQSTPVTLDADFDAHDGRMFLIGDFEFDLAAFNIPQPESAYASRVRVRLSIPEVASPPDLSFDEDELNGTGEYSRGAGPDGSGREGRGDRRNFEPAAFFQQRDTDGDGKLTGEEISERMAENLSEIDTDGDGAVSLEELQTRMRQRGEEDENRGESQ